MKLLALDLGATLGWCWGDSHVRSIGAERLAKGGSVLLRCGALHTWLRDFAFARGMPEQIVVENYLSPAASFSGAATEGQILLHGALHGFAGMHGIAVHSVSINTLRLHFCGQASAMPPTRGRTRTSAQKREARDATKRMVIRRAVQLRYFVGSDRRRADAVLAEPNDTVLFQEVSAMADAACVFDWGLAHVARAPGEFKLFEAHA